MKEKKEKKNNPFRDFVDENYKNIYQFSLLSELSHTTVYRIYKGIALPKRAVAIRIVRATKGKVSLMDLGILD